MAASRVLASTEAFYVSGTFWLTVAVVLLTVMLLGIAYWTATLTRARRVIHWEQSRFALLHRDSRIQAGLRMSWREEPIENPVLSTLRLTNVGRLDIGSASFDGGKPIVIDFGAPIVALIEPSEAPTDLMPIRLAGNSVQIGPGLLRRQEAVTIVTLNDGPGIATVTMPLENVKSREASAVQSGRYLARQTSRHTELKAVLFASVLISVIAASSAPWWWGNLPTAKPAYVIAGISGGCHLFTVVAQNGWPPYGAVAKRQPKPSSLTNEIFAGNEIIAVDGWVHGGAIYPTDASPWNSDVWYHLSDGRGWIAYPAVRAAQAQPHPTPTNPDGRPPAATTAACEGLVR
jgi:hypothetical protein